jgi:hypothetical protein
MAFIGNTVQTQGFTPAIDYFNGNGVTVTFTLSRPVASVAQVIVAVDNVIQNPSSAFSVVGNSITFTSAPLSGTNNIWVEYTSLITTYQGISQDPTVIGDIRATGGYLAEGDFGNSFVDGNLIDYVTGRGRFTVGELDDITFYHGGTAGRSAMMDLYYAGGAKIYGGLIFTGALGVGSSPSYGTTGQVLTSQGSGAAPIWSSLSAPSVNYLIVAGGGGGSSGNSGGGGGAGGLLTGNAGVSPSVSYTVTVGAGGSAGTPGTSGGSSSFTPVTTTALGGGNGQYGASSNAGSGGSGGGGSLYNVPGSGTSGQGFGGGGGGVGAADAAGGGGGAGGVGTSGVVNSQGGAGGVGVSSSISGSALNYAGGGGGGYYAGATPAAGGSGVGGNGGNNSTAATTGTTNRGGGGGGGGYSSGNASANGGSGVVIISYSSGYKLATATGTYTQTTVSGNYIFTFTGSGTITF